MFIALNNQNTKTKCFANAASLCVDENPVENYNYVLVKERWITIYRKIKKNKKKKKEKKKPSLKCSFFVRQREPN